MLRYLLLIVLSTIVVVSNADGINGVLESTVIVKVEQNGQTIAFGSGFVIDNDKILTNYHVIEELESIDDSTLFVEFSDGVRLPSKVLKSDESSDIALLSIYDVGKTPLVVDSKFKQGQHIYSLGNPMGLSFSLSEGIISAVRSEGNLIQITAPISSGSSGGPIFNDDGKIVGISTFMFEKGQNLNFAISSKVINNFLSGKSSKINIKQLDSSGSERISKDSIDFELATNKLYKIITNYEKEINSIITKEQRDDIYSKSGQLKKDIEEGRLKSKKYGDYCRSRYDIIIKSIVMNAKVQDIKSITKSTYVNDCVSSLKKVDLSQLTIKVESNIKINKVDILSLKTHLHNKTRYVYNYFISKYLESNYTDYITDLIKKIKTTDKYRYLALLSEMNIGGSYYEMNLTGEEKQLLRIINYIDTDFIYLGTGYDATNDRMFYLIKENINKPEYKMLLGYFHSKNKINRIPNTYLDYNKSVSIFEELARVNNYYAIKKLADIYAGVSVKTPSGEYETKYKDQKKERHYLIKLIDNDINYKVDIRDVFRLAEMYENGYGGNKKPDKAIDLYKYVISNTPISVWGGKYPWGTLDSYRGSLRNLFYLVEYPQSTVFGLRYVTEFLESKSPEEGFWFLLKFDVVQSLVLIGSANDIGLDDKILREYASLVSDHTNEEFYNKSYYEAGRMYLEGEGGKFDFEKAKAYLEKAKKYGNTEAEVLLNKF